MREVKIFGIILLLLLMIFIIGCKSQQEPNVNVPNKEINLTPSAVPPTQQELIQLKNGYQITLGLKLKIDQRCAANGLRGGDTGHGYGCIA